MAAAAASVGHAALPLRLLGPTCSDFFSLLIRTENGVTGSCVFYCHFDYSRLKRTPTFAIAHTHTNISKNMLHLISLLSNRYFFLVIY